MKKLLGFMVVMFAVTTQNAMGEHYECINFTNWGDNAYRCDNFCNKRGGMKKRVLIHGSHKPDMGPQELTEYERCVEGERRALCVCSQ